MAESAQTGKGSGESRHGDESAPPTLVEGEAPSNRSGDLPRPVEREQAAQSHTARSEQKKEPASPRPKEPSFPKENDTHTQPSLSALSDRPPASLDIRRLWRIEEQFDRHDARIRLLEKELTKTRMLAVFSLSLIALFALFWLARG